MKLAYTYVDNSNVFIEGQRVAAVQSGKAIDIDDAIERKIFDYSWQIDYGRLHEFACGQDGDIGCAKLWGSPPPGDSFWKMVERKGFTVKTYERSFGKERKVDVAIAYEIAKDVAKIGKKDTEIILVAGDKDFVPVVTDLKAEGFTIKIMFWDHAAREIKEGASNFISLNKWLNHLKFGT